MSLLPAIGRPTGTYQLDPGKTVPQEASSFIGRQKGGLLAPMARASKALPNIAVANAVQDDWYDRDVRSEFEEKTRAEQQAKFDATPLGKQMKGVNAGRAQAMAAPPSIAEAPPNETFGEFQERAYAITPKVLPVPFLPRSGAYENDPKMGTEVAERNMRRMVKTGNAKGIEALRPFLKPVEMQDGKLVERKAPEGVGEKLWSSVVGGFKDAGDQLAGINAIPVAIVNKVTGDRRTGAILKRFTDYARWSAKDAEFSQVTGDNAGSQAVYDAVRALPAFVIQLGIGAVTGGTGFALAAGAQSGGAQFQQSIGEGATPGEALADAAIASSVTAATNIPVGRYFFPGLQQKVAGAMATTRMRALAKAVAGGALREGTQEMAEQAGTDFLVAFRRMATDEQWDAYVKEHPQWVGERLQSAVRAGLAGALLGGAAGPLHVAGQHGASPDATQQQLSELGDGTQLRGPATVLTMTPEQAALSADRVADRQVKVDAAERENIVHQRRVGKAADWSALSNEQLGSVVASGNNGETVKAGGRDYAVTVPMAADELMRRRAASMPQKGSRLEVGESGEVTDESLSKWAQANPAVVGQLATQETMSRSALDRIAGRPVSGGNAQFRAELLGRIKGLAPKPDTSGADQVESEIASLPVSQQELVQRGLAPSTARLVERAEEPMPKMPDPDTQAGERIARLNSVNPDTVRVRGAETDAERKAEQFAQKRGLKARFFDTADEIPTVGYLHDGVMHLNADMSESGMVVSVAAHEALDSLHKSDPKAWHELAADLERVAPDAMKAVRERYAKLVGEQGTQTLTDADIEREGASNILSALFDAFDLHLAVDDSGNIDKGKARALVQGNPGLWARIALAFRNALSKVGLKGAATGMNDAQADALARYAKGTELDSPQVRSFIANRLADTLNAMQSAAVQETSGAQSIRKGKRSSKRAEEMAAKFKDAKKEIGRGQKRIDLAHRIGTREGQRKEAEVGAAAKKNAALKMRQMRVEKSETASRSQRAIDLAHAIGRRSGLMAGQIEGQRTGRKEGAKAATKRIAELRALANDAIKTLPKKWRANYALSEAATDKQVEQIAERVRKDLARIPAHEKRSEAREYQRTIAGAANLRRSTRADAMRLAKEAVAILSGPPTKANGKVRSGGTIGYTGNLADRIAIASQKLAQAEALVKQGQADYKEMQAERAQMLGLDKALAADALAGKKASLPDPANPGSPRLPKWWSYQSLSTLPHRWTMRTFIANNGGEGGVFGQMWNGVLSAIDAKDGRMQGLAATLGDIAKKHGFESLHSYFERARTEKVTATIAGKQREIELGHALRLIAQDPETVALYDGKQGYVARTDKGVGSGVQRITSDEIAKLRGVVGEDLASMVDEMKAAKEKANWNDAKEANYRLNGTEPKKVKGYMGRTRLGEDFSFTADMDPDDIARNVTKRIGSMSERSGGDKPFIVGDFVHDLLAQAEDESYLIHLAEPAQHTMRVLKSAGTKDAVAKAYGERMNDLMQNHLLASVGLAKGSSGWLEKLTGNVAPALINWNATTGLRQLGGIPRLYTEIGAAPLAEGAAMAVSMSPSKHRAIVAAIEARSPYARSRWTQMQAARQAGLLGTSGGAELRSALAKQIKAAIAGTFDAAMKGRLGKALEEVSRGTGDSVRYLRAMDQMLAWFDQRVFAAAVFANEAKLAKTNPGLDADDRRNMAIDMAARNFQGTQNSSRQADDPMGVTWSRVHGGAGRLLFPFSSDALIGNNQLAQAWASGDRAKLARALTALGMNTAVGAGAGYAVQAALAGAVRAVGGGTGDDDDDRTAKELMRRNAFANMGAFAVSGMLGNIGSVQGLLAGAVAESAMTGRKTDFGNNILAVRALSDSVNGIIDAVEHAAGGHSEKIPDDALKSLGSAVNMTGLPVVPPVRQAYRAVKDANPGRDRIDRELRRQARE